MINLPLNIDFSGKVVVVTGAGGLICGAMAAAFYKKDKKTVDFLLICDCKAQSAVL